MDDRRDNCDAAEQVGFRSIWAHPGAQLEREVAERLGEVADPMTTAAR